MPHSLKRILITPGEPAGIGPDIVIMAAQMKWPAELIVVADPKLLEERAQLLGLPLQLIECDWHEEVSKHQPGQLKIYPVSLKVPVKPGELNADNAQYVIETLTIASYLCKNKTAQALVTGPVHKGIINQSGQHFTGHTEFLAKYCSVEH